MGILFIIAGSAFLLLTMCVFIWLISYALGAPEPFLKILTWAIVGIILLALVATAVFVSMEIIFYGMKQL